MDLQTLLGEVHLQSWLHDYLRRNLLKAGMSTPIATYMRLTVRATELSVLPAVIAAVLFPRLWFLCLAIPPAAFLIFLVRAQLHWQLQRKSEIEDEIPYILSFMTLMAQSNTPADKIFQSLATMETTKPVRVEAVRIVRDTSLFGHDILTAMLTTADLSPSETFADILNGIVRTVRTGGDLPRFLRLLLQRAYSSRTVKLDEILNRISMYSMMYVMALVVAPLSAVIMLVMMGVFGGGLDVRPIIYLVDYLVIPLLAFFIWILVDRARTAGAEVKLPKEIAH
ncbi:MAG: type II secretion system F family protein [Candidatus Bathyarchaeia archaeon]